MRLAVFTLLASVPLCAAEGIPRWERVITDVLRRAEAESVKRTAPAAEEPQPAAVHPTVEQFVRFYRGPGAGTWKRSVQRLEAIRPTVERIFAEEGVPAELLWLGLVESGYNPAARSPKNAAGVWQFIPATAERFGLEVSGRDERFDTTKATRAAARYLRFLYGSFGDWPLALAAYNAGEARVEAAVRAAGTRDFWSIADRGLLPRETRAYVPAVLAAQLLGTGEPLAYAQATPRKPQTVEAPFTLSP